MQLYPRVPLLTANTLIVPQQGVCVWKCELDFMSSLSQWMFALDSSSVIPLGSAYQRQKKAE